MRHIKKSGAPVRPSLAAETLFSRRVAEDSADRLFRSIAQELGPAVARQIFRRFAKPPPKGALPKLQRKTILELYEAAGRPPKRTFAKQMVANGYEKTYAAILQALNRATRD
jgi:hypothetical protein